MGVEVGEGVEGEERKTNGTELCVNREDAISNWALKSLHVTYTEGDRSVSVIGPSSHYMYAEGDGV